MMAGHPVCPRAQEACCVSEREPGASPPQSLKPAGLSPSLLPGTSNRNATIRPGLILPERGTCTRAASSKVSGPGAGLGSGRCSALSCGFWGEGAQASLVVKDDLKLRGAVFDLVIVTNGIH